MQNNLLDVELENEQKYKTGGMLAVEKHYKTAVIDRTAGKTALGVQLASLQFEHLKTEICTWITSTLAPKAGAKPSYHALLANIVDKYTLETFAETSSIVILNTLISQLIAKNAYLSNVANSVYRDVELELNTMYAFNQLSDGNKELALNGLKERSQKNYRMNYIRYFCQNRGNIDVNIRTWDTTLAQEIMTILVYICVKSSDWFCFTESDSTTTSIEATEKLLKAWGANVEHLIAAGRKFCPMVVKPREWKDLHNGGYYGCLAPHTMLLRLNNLNTVYAKQYIQRLNQTDISNTLIALNSIQETPWKINSTVLEVLEHFMKQGGNKAGLPPTDIIDIKPKLYNDEPSKQELKTYKKAMKAFVRREKQRQSHLLRLYANMAIAKDFAKYERIYFPHNMDFRGRIYPIPSFNPQGDDVTKGLLKFADTPCLTDNNQLKWLFVMGANLAGVDKVSYEDRIAWVQKNENAIIASAMSPIDNTFWQVQDEPFQFLAFCLEFKSMKDYLATHNGNINGWSCGLPIAFDGTCSGLQHFSAILRDSVGGKAVNLLDSDKPQDIYGVVAKKVNELLEIDATSGTLDTQEKGRYEDVYTKLGTRTMAQVWLAYGVTRKVTKRNVMTLAYGSKQYGFREQLLEDIIKPDIDLKEDSSLFVGSPKQYATYLAGLIWQAVSTTVVRAVEGMAWLQEVSKLVTKDSNVITWTTPCGLPIQQHYMEYNVKTIQLRILDTRVRLYTKQNTGNIDTRRQVSGIAPNFIHSMDSSHLQLTILACHNAGIKHFATIHDSYACPLPQADTLYKLVRKCFVDMYTDTDVLATFREYLQHFSDTKLPEPPMKGDLNLNDVLSSKYFVC